MLSSVVGPKSEAGLGAKVKAARNCFSFSVFAVAGNNLLMHAWQYLAVSIMMNNPLTSRHGASDSSATGEEAVSAPFL